MAACSLSVVKLEYTVAEEENFLINILLLGMLLFLLDIDSHVVKTSAWYTVILSFWLGEQLDCKQSVLFCLLVGLNYLLDNNQRANG